MTKFLFLDYREIETISGFARKLEQPVKHEGNPLFIADQPWENGNMQLYGSVLKAEGRPFQMWYTVIHRPWTMYLCYAESDDGIQWRKPLFDIFEHEGQQTNIVFAEDPHGTAVIYDEAEPREDRRYKLVSGTAPSGCISAHYSPDGIHWSPVRQKGHPVITTNPDSPMAFLRQPTGRYAVHHRLHGHGRRVFRSESWDFRFFSGEPRMIVEPDAGDPPQIQFYGMGAAPYGSYEIGTLWIFSTDPDEMGFGKSRGYQEAELTYARHGHAWHRAAQGTPFIPHGGADSWERGNLQCASQPVFLDDEIRYYYMGTTMTHQRHWELEPQTAGVGMASMQPDRFVALCAGGEPAELLTVSFRLPSTELLINAATESNGWVRVEVLDAEGAPVKGLGRTDCVPVKGDSTSHQPRWSREQLNHLVGKSIRLRLRARNARLYSIYATEPDEEAVYHRFTAPRP
ncbi:MAG: hypothetical protein PVJ27_09065 [Candidatus Brocadiaceae bacterium]|jgi:hypothetical protein